MEEIVLLLEKEINLHGELHLDAVKTQAVMNYLKTVARVIDVDFERTRKELQGIADDVKRLSYDPI